MAESKLNQELRVAQMIQIDDGLITSRCAPLPADWLAMDLVRVANENGADGFCTARYKARDEFFNQRDRQRGCTTRSSARQMYFGGTPDPVDGTVQARLLRRGPGLRRHQQSWIYTKYPHLYLFAAFMHAGLHAVGEEQVAANFKQLAEDMIQKLNAAHLGSKASGSRVTRPRHWASDEGTWTPDPCEDDVGWTEVVPPLTPWPPGPCGDDAGWTGVTIAAGPIASAPMARGLTGAARSSAATSGTGDGLVPQPAGAAPALAVGASPRV